MMIVQLRLTSVINYALMILVHSTVHVSLAICWNQMELHAQVCDDVILMTAWIYCFRCQWVWNYSWYLWSHLCWHCWFLPLWVWFRIQIECSYKQYMWWYVILLIVVRFSTFNRYWWMYWGDIWLWWHM